MDRYDLRAAEEAQRTERLALVRKSFERQRWDEGVQQLQAVWDDSGDSLIFEETRVWRPASEVALDLIRRAPGDALRAYETRYQAIAERDLKIARKANDLAGVLLVSRRYLLTSAGQQASRVLIDAAIDHGNGDAIGKQVRDLLRVDSSELRDGAWRDELKSILQALGQTGVANQLESASASVEPSAAAAHLWDLARLRGPSSPRDEWSTLSGDSTGQSMARVEEPTLLPRWRMALVTHPRIRQILREQALAFEDQGALGLSLLGTVGSKDVLVTRTLANLTAVNVHTGQVLWTSRDWAPLVDPAEGFDDENQTVEAIIPDLERESSNALGYRIRQRMTTCGSLGTLSANSRHVFALASFPSEVPPFEELVQSGFEESETSRTYLFARDLLTGQIAWRAGGPDAEEPPGLPAAGVFFFGPPIPDGDELFAIGERHGDLLLFCLEAETGFVRWEQLLAAAGRTLRNDEARRSWTAAVAVRGSLVICPTTTGWLTAVDRVSRKIVWSVRIVPRSPDNADSEESDSIFESANREGSLDERWPPLQPILLRDRVVVAPIEFPDEAGNTEPQLLCFDLNSGDKIWETPKETLVGVIGASAEHVYVFNRLQVRAISTATGTPAWTRAIEELIAGRPLLTQSGILVPTQEGTIIRLTEATGEVAEQLQLGSIPMSDQATARLLDPENSHPLSLGNLMSLGGRLISVSPSEMTAFEWKADEPRWQATASTEIESSIRWAQSRALLGQFSEAMQTLRDSEPLTHEKPSVADRHRKVQLSVLVLQLGSELQGTGTPPGQTARLDEARALARSPEDREEVMRLSIEMALHNSDWATAWTRIRETLRQPLRFDVAQGPLIVSPDAWLADRILRLGQIPDQKQRDAMRVAIRDEFSALWEATSADRTTRERLLRRFAETPFVDAAELETLTGQKERLTLARLEALSHSRDRTVAGRASLQLIERLAALPDWVDEARARLALIPGEADWPPEQLATRELLEKSLAVTKDALRRTPSSWVGRKSDLRRFAEDSQQPERELPLVWIGAPSETLEDFTYFYDSALKTVVIERTDGSRSGELLLASNEDNPTEENAPVLYGSGLQVYLMHMGVIHAFSMPERQLLWRRNADHIVNFDPHMNTEFPSYQGRLKTPRSGDVGKSADSTDVGSTLFEVASSRQLVVRTRRGIEVLNSLTGHVEWSLPRCPHARVRCDDDQFYRFTGHRAEAFSIRSGRPIDAPLDSEFEERLLPFDGHGLTTLQEQPGDGLTWKLERVRCRADTIHGRSEGPIQRWDEMDLLQLESVWTQPVAANCLIGDGPVGRGIWVEAGELRLIDWASGQTQSLGRTDMAAPSQTASDRTKTEFLTCWDRSRLYTITSEGEYPSIINGPALPAYGKLAVYSRERSELEWNSPTNGFLLTQSLRRFPCLPFLKLEELPIAGYACQKVILKLVDKATGQEVSSIQTPTWGMGASGSRYDPQSERWSLYLAGERMQLQPRKAPPPSPGIPGGR